MLIQDHPDGVVIRIRVQPRASKNRIAGIMGDAYKVAVTSPPVDGAANSACVEFLAELLKIPKSRVEIISGHTGRTKLLKIYGMNSRDIKEKIEGKS